MNWEVTDQNREQRPKSREVIRMAFETLQKAFSTELASISCGVGLNRLIGGNDSAAILSEVS